MRKYMALARAALLEATQEKAEILIWVTLDAIPVFIMGSLWLANREKLTTMSISQIITYYVMVMIIGRVTEFYFDEDMSDQVRSGDFSRFLLLPISLPFAFIPQNMGRKVFSGGIMIVPMMLIVLTAFRKYLILPDSSTFILFSLSLIITIGMRFALSTLAAAGAFFWDQAEALVHARWILELVAGGYSLPLSLYPSWLRVIPESLPFKYIYYVPVSIFTRTFDRSTTLITLAIGMIWLAVMLWFANFVWKRGITRYSGVGG